MMRASAWLGMVLLVTCPAAAQDLSVKTEDGLELVLTPNGGIATVRAAGEELPLGKQPGGFFLAEAPRELPPNLIQNGSLEQDADRNGIPDGFRCGSDWSREGSGAHSGKYCMKCAIPGPEDKISSSLLCEVPVEGGTAYLVSLWLKSEKRAGHYAASVAYLQQLDENGERTTAQFQQTLGGSVRGDQQWTKLRLALVTQPNTRRITLRTDIFRGHGTIWADDFSVQKLGSTPAPLTGQVRPQGDALQYEGELAEQGLHVTAAFRADEARIVVDGEVEDETGEDRCVTLSYRVPLAAVGGEWWDDISTRRRIAAGDRIGNTRSWGTCGPYSIYPVATVHPPGAKAALALGVPMDLPRPYRLLYADLEGLQIAYDFGLTAATKKFPSKASFRFILYQHDPQWGFRAAIKKYYDLYPEFFRVRVPKQGNWYYADLHTLPNDEDFGLAFNEQSGTSAVQADDERGNLSFRYTEPWGYWHRWGPKEQSKRPTYEQAMKKLGAEAQAPPDQAGGHIGSPVREQAEAIRNSACYDAGGKLRLDGWHQWGQQRDWFLYFTCNPDPDLAADGRACRASQTWTYELERAYRAAERGGAKLDGVYLDSIAYWTRVCNYRRDHYALADLPLTFDALERRPTQLQLFAHYEFVLDLRHKLDERHGLLMANIFPYNYVFFNHLLDVMGHEVWGDQSRALFNLERTLAYQKPYCLLMQLKPEVPRQKREAWMRSALFFGIFPNIVGGTTDVAQYERFRDLFKRYMPTIIELATAGWEPITHAKASREEVGVERFGPKDDAVYFTVKNFAEERQKVRLDFSLGELGVEAPGAATEMLTGEELPLEQGKGGVCRCEIELEPNEVRVFKMGLTAE